MPLVVEIVNWALKARDSEDPIDHGNATGTGVLDKRMRSDECALLHCEGIRPSKLLVMNSPANGLATANLLAAFRCQGGVTGFALADSRKHARVA